MGENRNKRQNQNCHTSYDSPRIEIIGKTVYQAVTDSNVHYEAVKAINERFPSGATTVIMDLTVEAEAFGAEINFPVHADV